jgi:hypothetical protein
MATLRPGEYDVLVQLPDASEVLADRPEYAVRFANVGVWEEKTGMNRLGDVARVK